MQPVDAARPLRILYIDHASDFGGSLVVADTIVAAMPPDRVMPFVAIAVKNEFSSRLFATARKVTWCWIPLPYKVAARVKSRIGCVRFRLFRRLLSVGLAVADLVSSWLYCAQLVAIMLWHKIDIVHTNNAIEAIFAAKLVRRPVVFHLHGLVLRRITMLNACDAVVAISKFVEDRMVEAGLRSDLVEVVPNGIRMPITDGLSNTLLERLRLPADVPLVVIPGRIVAWKGQEQFLYAAQIVLQKVPAAHFVLVGSTSDGEPAFEQSLVHLAEVLGLTDRVHWTGYVNNVSDYLTVASVVVHASIEPEPFGLVIVEGMASGTPVVASCLGAGKEIITSGVDGLLVDPRDPAELADAICRLLLNPDWAREIGAAGRNTVLKRFSAESMACAFQRIYARLATTH